MDNDSITLLALRVLENAVEIASVRPLVPDDGIRLALTWLHREGVMRSDSCRLFWTLLSKDDPDRPEQEAYARRMNLSNLVGYSFHMLGWEFLAREGRKPMCNRYLRSDRDAIGQLFDARPLRDFNDGPAIVHPRDPAPVVRIADGARVVQQMQWGFPFVFKGKSGQPLKPKAVNNARFNKLPTTWSRWWFDLRNRCLIPARAYAEAEGPAGKKTTTWLSVDGQADFAWAGLWTQSDEWGAVFTGVMTDATTELREIHDRAPVIIEREDWDVWLKGSISDVGRLDRPLPAERMHVDRTSVAWTIGGDEKAYSSSLPFVPQASVHTEGA